MCRDFVHTVRFNSVVIFEAVVGGGAVWESITVKGVF